MIYTIAAYHDIGHYINPQKHEKESAKIFNNDKKIKNYFNEKEIKNIEHTLNQSDAQLGICYQNRYNPSIIYLDK